MGERGFRYSIVTSNGTLLVTFLYMTAMRLLSLNSNISEPSIWGGYLATVVVGYFLLELNNRNALLRVRSRMVSSTFLVLVGTFPVLLDFSTGFVSAGAMRRAMCSTASSFSASAWWPTRACCGSRPSSC